jgi:GrpB-like predicted nucleotidyltransferase (UPF0157 family)
VKPDVTRHTDLDPDGIEWVGRERSRGDIVIAEPDPRWVEWYVELATRVRRALGAGVLELQHIGSTSVPGLPAKPIIDIDLTVADPRDEAAYVPALEAEGFWLRIREPAWHEHRLLYAEHPHANLHVFGPGSPEVVRHRLLRDWLLAHDDDRARYAAAKRAAASAANAGGESTMDYNQRKEPVVREILDRMFRAQGLLPSDDG